MCEIDSSVLEKYEKGEVPLGREVKCKGCGFKDIINVWIGKEVICPECNSKNLEFGDMHNAEPEAEKGVKEEFFSFIDKIIKAKTLEEIQKTDPIYIDRDNKYLFKKVNWEITENKSFFLVTLQVSENLPLKERQIIFNLGKKCIKLANPSDDYIGKDGFRHSSGSYNLLYGLNKKRIIFRFDKDVLSEVAVDCLYNYKQRRWTDNLLGNFL